MKFKRQIEFYNCPQCGKPSSTKLYTNQWVDRYCDDCNLYWEIPVMDNLDATRIDVIDRKTNKIVYTENL